MEEEARIGEKMAEENGSTSDVGSQENLAADVINLEIEEVGRSRIH